MADGGGGVQAGAVERKIGLRLGWLGYGGAHDVLLRARGPRDQQLSWKPLTDWNLLITTLKLMEKKDDEESENERRGIRWKM